MAQTKRKANYKKLFQVYGRFSAARETECRFVVWEVRARSLATAIRQGVTEFWQRPEIRWKHFATVTITAQMVRRSGPAVLQADAPAMKRIKGGRHA